MIACRSNKCPHGVIVGSTIKSSVRGHTKYVGTLSLGMFIRKDVGLASAGEEGEKDMLFLRIISIYTDVDRPSLRRFPRRFQSFIASSN